MKRISWEEWWNERHTDFIIEVSKQEDWTHHCLAHYEAWKWYKEFNNDEYIDHLEEVIKGLVEGLEFYSNEDNWEDCWVDGCPGKEDYYTTVTGKDLRSIKDDMGSRVGGWYSRETLSKYKATIDNIRDQDE